MSNSKLQPILKWAGGKRWLIPHLSPVWTNFADRRLVEPFCGGLAVSLNLKPDSALLNDINRHLINLYEWIQRGLIIESHFKNDKEFYLERRREFNDFIKSGLEHQKRAAELFYYLNRTGYNGLCRFNKKGLYNVPFGKYKTINYRKTFHQYVEIFNRWKFSSSDFENLPISKGRDFIYADPPYDVEFRQYAEKGFGWYDQVRLVKWLSEQGCPVVASNQATDRIIRLYEDYGFLIRRLDGPRRISCKGDRKPAGEILATKNIGVAGTL